MAFENRNSKENPKIADNWEVNTITDIECELHGEAAIIELAEIRELFEWDCPDNFWAIRISCVNFSKDGVLIDGLIFAAGQRVGSFSRTILNHREYLIHFSQTLDDGFQGQGFGRQWFEVCETRYREHGFLGISLTANSLGRVIWPKFGFKVRDNWQREKILETAAEVVVRMCESQELTAEQVEYFLTKLEKEKPDAPELVLYGQEIDIPVGERVLLAYGSWGAFKALD